MVASTTSAMIFHGSDVGAADGAAEICTAHSAETLRGSALPEPSQGAVLARAFLLSKALILRE